MCFSATASFGSAIVLTIIGVATVRKTNTTSQLPFSFIPFVFAIQQICEGFIWLSFTDNHFLQWRYLCTYIFLTSAYIIWPVLIPYSVMKLEQNVIRKKILLIIFGIGLSTSIIYGYAIVLKPTACILLGRHILYQLSYPSWILIEGSFFYGVATMLPHIVSSTKKVWILGFLITLSYIVARIYFHDYLISVWCYFAALISATIYFILKSINSADKKTAD